MKTKVLCLFVFLMFITVGFLQAEEAQACEVVSSAQQAASFESTLKDLRQMQARYESPIACCQNVYRTNDFHYFIFTKINGLADLDDMFQNLAMVAQKAGTEWFDLIDRFAGTFETETIGTFYIRNDLASQPRGFGQVENKIVDMEFYYLKSGKWPAFEKILQSNRELNSTKSLNGGYDVLEAHLWSNLPLYIVIRYGDGGGRLSRPLAKQAADICRKVEHRTAQFMKELSNTHPGIEETVE
jgi:hypothetical protein